MAKSTAATLTAVTLALLRPVVLAQDQAQQPIITVPFYGYDGVSFDASVIAAGSDATTLSLWCAPPASTVAADGSDPDDECGLFPEQILTYGPSTYHMYMAEGTDFTGTQDCSTEGTTAAVCTESAGGISANFPGVSTTEYSGTDVGLIPVTITAGAEKLSASAGNIASATASTTQTASDSGSVTLITGSATITPSSTLTSSSGSHASTTTGSAGTASPSHGAAVSNVYVSGSAMGGILAVIMGLLL